MVKAENNDLSKSVEHMIPNAALTQKRGKGEGDFYACRKCNARKSNIDYVLGIIVKSQSKISDLSLQSMWNALDDTKRNKRFIDMILSAQQHGDNVSLPLPIKPTELAEYVDFLAKGQYFKKHKKPLSMKQNTVSFEIVNKLVLNELEKIYGDMNKSHPFKDLQLNPRTETIQDGECLIWSKNNQHLFIFHEGVALILKILKRNKLNMQRRQDSINKFLR